MIVPAILTNHRDELLRLLKISQEFTDYVQIDIMDGIFVPSKSINIGDLEGLLPAIGSEAHLMVENPIEWIEPFKKFGAQRIIFHFEIKNDHGKIIEEIRNADLEAGLAINPSTKLEDFRHLLDKIDILLFMAVNPGFYGSPFIPAVLEKIKQFKDEYPSISAGIDGGIKFDNIKMVKKTGADYICIGSAILKEANPKEAYLKFLQITNE